MHRRRVVGVLGQPGLDAGLRLGPQPAVHVGVELVPRDAVRSGHLILLMAGVAPASTSSRNRWRPRLSRDMTVPSGTSSTSAASA